MGIIKIALDFYKGEANFSTLFEFITHPRIAFKYLIVAFLYILGTTLGLILLIVPGIIFMLRFWFSFIFIIDQDAGIIGSFEKSAELTRGVTGKMFLYLLAIVLVNAVASFLIVGSLVTVPLITLANVYIYKKLLAQ